MVLNPQIGRERAQIYANFIRVLMFQDHQEDLLTFMELGPDGSRPGGHAEEDALWHPQLGQLKFPLLEDLNMWRTRGAEEFNTENAILHYIHSGLRDLRVDASGPLSDRFLDEVSRLCPCLQQFDMGFQNATISKQGLVRFLQQMHRLEGIHVAALDKSWSAAAFAAVAKHERLKLLHVPPISDTWFDDIEVSAPFPALKELYALDTTGKALLRMHSANPGLEVIHLYNGSVPGPEDVLSVVSNFSRLMTFKYRPNPSTAVSGRELTLEISCGSDWVTFGHASQQQWSFVHLKTLSLSPSVHMDEALSEVGYKALLQHFKSFAIGWFPEMQFFNIIEADDREQAFNDFMYEVGYRRENDSDVDSNGAFLARAVIVAESLRV
ncbi:hypothetical protein E8E12_002071 [Didymella heteroderae]|uniref:Uncharacterized protein n=1 Tax=Didymella heteroderae TaxID=1769908 RepID=A0A9P5C1G7_9PLEO|nr:hypothetical protein E8E12_002071 [Didymella heteroderae]